MDGGSWLATVHGFAKSRARLSDFTFFSFTFKVERAPQVALMVQTLPANARDTGDTGSVPG